MQGKNLENYFKSRVRITKIVILKTAIQTDQLTGEPYCFIKGLLYK